MATRKELAMGQDLKLRFDEQGADLSVTRKGDLGIIFEEENLAQAIITRLATEKGELSDIGHPEYGSRLNDVIGEIHNEDTIRKIKAIIIECLAQERRIKRIASINVFSDPYIRHKVIIEISVQPHNGEELLTLTYPFSLEG